MRPRTASCPITWASLRAKVCGRSSSRSASSTTPSEAWLAKYKAATESTIDRAKMLSDAAEEIEQGMTTLGATAIEDKLQQDVAGTIADLARAGIKLWVLTGDKEETAINIGHSCKVLREEMTLMTVKGGAKEVAAALRSLHEKISHLRDAPPPGMLKRLRSMTSFFGSHGKAKGAKKEKAFESEHLALVVDGPSLVHILGYPEEEELLLDIGKACKSVIACRVSPAQKALIVEMVKEGCSPKPTTLAIGDGANDVGMIQSADLGVGISGKEGMQAVNSSDFAIAQFRFLRRLLLIHGRWNYCRMAKVILYSFYKNVAITLTIFISQFAMQFTGTLIYENSLYSYYNVFFLAMPIVAVGTFDQDVRRRRCWRTPALYVSGRAGMHLNPWKMATRTITAGTVVISALPFLFAQNGDDLGSWGLECVLLAAALLRVLSLAAALTAARSTSAESAAPRCTRF